MPKQDKRIEYVKHLNTLSTGAIVLLATFLEKVFAQAQHRGMAALAIGAFLTSVIAAVASYTLEVVFEEPTLQRTPWRTLDTAASAVMWFAFLVGITALAAFAIMNLV